MPLIILNVLISSTSAPKNKSKCRALLVSVVVLMRGCSGTDEYEAGKEKITVYSLQKLEYTTASDDSASLISMILSLIGPGIRPETTVGKHNPPCHLQMPN